MRERQLQYSLYRWITWGSKRLSSFPRSHYAVSTQLQLPAQCRQTATATDPSLISLNWRLPTWTTTEKQGPGQNHPNTLAYMPRFPRWLTIFYSTWDWKQQGKRENEVTHLLFIGYQPPHSAAFQLRWILNVIFFLQLHTEKLLSEKEITEFNNISCDMVICLVTVSATFTTYSSGLIDHKYKCSHILSCSTDF